MTDRDELGRNPDTRFERSPTLRDECGRGRCVLFRLLALDRSAPSLGLEQNRRTRRPIRADVDDDRHRPCDTLGRSCDEANVFEREAGACRDGQHRRDGFERELTVRFEHDNEARIAILRATRLRNPTHEREHRRDVIARDAVHPRIARRVQRHDDMRIRNRREIDRMGNDRRREKRREHEPTIDDFEADLEARDAQLQTWFYDESGELLAGAYYVEIERLDR